MLSFKYQCLKLGMVQGLAMKRYAIIHDFYAQHYANVGRGFYRLAEQATVLYQFCLQRLAHLLALPADYRLIVLPGNAVLWQHRLQAQCNFWAGLKVWMPQRVVEDRPLAVFAQPNFWQAWDAACIASGYFMPDNNLTILVVKEAWALQLPAVYLGGGMLQQMTKQAWLPVKTGLDFLQAGTPPLAQMLGLLATLDPSFSLAEPDLKRDIYFDNASSLPKTQAALQAFLTTAQLVANWEAVQHKQMALDTRLTVAQFLNVEPEEIFFSPQGSTYAINWLVEFGLGSILKPGDNIMTSVVEHHSNLAVWQRLAEQKGLGLQWLMFDKANWRWDFTSIVWPEKQSFGLLAISLASNVLGPLWQDDFADLKYLINQAHARGWLVLLDASQAVVHSRLDLKSLLADLVVFSAHKVGGPMNLGVCYIAKNAQKQLFPARLDVGSNFVDLDSLALRFLDRPGEALPWAPDVAMLKVAIEQLSSILDTQGEHVASLMVKLVNYLLSVDGVVIFGDPVVLRQHGFMVSFRWPGIGAHDLAAWLAEQGIAVRAGYHCAQPLHEELNLPHSVRVSFAWYNTPQEVDALIMVLQKANVCLSVI